MGGGTHHRREAARAGALSVGQVARLAEPELASILGRAAGRHLHALAHNRDPRRVRGRRRRRSIGTQRALGRSAKTRYELDVVLIGLVDRLARRLRAARRVCRTVTIRLRFGDFSRATRSHTLVEATAQSQTILITAKGLLASAMPTIERQGITLLGVALANLSDEGAIQLAFPLDRARPGALDSALDEIRDRFGTTAITRAALIGRDQGLTVPLLPD